MAELDVPVLFKCGCRAVFAHELQIVRRDRGYNVPVYMLVGRYAICQVSSQAKYSSFSAAYAVIVAARLEGIDITPISVEGI